MYSVLSDSIDLPVLPITISTTNYCFSVIMILSICWQQAFYRTFRTICPLTLIIIYNIIKRREFQRFLASFTLSRQTRLKSTDSKVLSAFYLLKTSTIASISLSRYKNSKPLISTSFICLPQEARYDGKTTGFLILLNLPRNSWSWYIT